MFRETWKGWETLSRAFAPQTTFFAWSSFFLSRPFSALLIHLFRLVFKDGKKTNAKKEKKRFYYVDYHYLFDKLTANDRSRNSFCIRLQQRRKNSAMTSHSGYHHRRLLIIGMRFNCLIGVSLIKLLVNSFCLKLNQSNWSFIGLHPVCLYHQREKDLL